MTKAEARESKRPEAPTRRLPRWLIVGFALVFAFVYGTVLVDRLGAPAGISIGILFAIAVVWIVLFPGGPRAFSEQHPNLDGCFFLPISWVVLLKFTEMPPLEALAWSATATALLVLGAWSRRRRTARG